MFDSQAVLVDHTLYLSGSLGVDVKTGKLVAGGAAVEARQALINMGHVLKEAGSNYDKGFICLKFFLFCNLLIYIFQF